MEFYLDDNYNSTKIDNLNKQLSIPWVEKYRPKKMDDVIQDDTIKSLLYSYVSTGDMPHILLYGPPGTGKTSTILAIGREIFKDHFNDRVIEFNASDDRGINAVRDYITNEAKKYVSTIKCPNGDTIPAYKIIILDEADSMTEEAQDALRVIIEKYSTVTRFCFICNYICKITDAIKSRCYPIYFKKLETKSMVNKLKIIAESEDINLDNNIYENIIDISNGDMRKAIVLLQNIKYTYALKSINNKTINQMSTQDMQTLYVTSETGSDIITTKDVYNIFACIYTDVVLDILEKIFLAKNIVELMTVSKFIVSLGYPIDNVINQIVTEILKSSKLNDIKKASIMYYSGQIFYRMKIGANENIQLLDFITFINKSQ